MVTKDMTPEKYADAYASIPLFVDDAVGDAGTFNSVVCVAAGTSILTDRWLFKSFADAGSPAAQRVAAQWGFSLPDDYRNGTDVRIRFIWTNTDTTGNADWVVGLAKLTAGGVLGGEGETEYITYTEAATAGSTFESIISATKSFDGSTLSSGEQCSIIIYRDGGADTIASTCYIYAVEVQYVNESGDSKVSNFKDMTPRLHKNASDMKYFSAVEFDSDAGTFNGITANITNFTVNIDRFPSHEFVSPGADVITVRWMAPLNYKPGTDITFAIRWFSEGTAGGNVRWNLGMCTDILGNTFGADDDTEYDASDYAAGTVANVEKIASFTFDGTGINPGDAISFVVLRDSSHANDTASDDIRVVTTSAVYTKESYGAAA